MSCDIAQGLGVENGVELSLNDLVDTMSLKVEERGRGDRLTGQTLAVQGRCHKFESQNSNRKSGPGGTCLWRWR